MLRSAVTESARMKALLRIGHAYLEPFDSAGVVAYAEASEAVARRLGDSVGVALALDLRGDYYRQAYSMRQAIPLLLRAEYLLRSAQPGTVAYANVVYHLAMSYGTLGSVPKALRYHRQARQLFTRNNVPDQAAEVDNSMGLLYTEQNQPDSAAHYLYRAVRAQHRLGRPVAEAAALGNLALLYYQRGQLVEASRYARQAYALESAAHDTTAFTQTLAYLSVFAAKQDSLPQALRYQRIADNLFRRIHLTGQEANSATALAGLFSRMHKPDSAIAYYRRAIALHQQVDMPQHSGAAMTSLANFHLTQHELAQATYWANQALALQQPDVRAVVEPLALKVLLKVAVEASDMSRAYALSQRLRELDQARHEREEASSVADLRVGYETEQAEQQARIGQLEATEQAGRARLYALIAGGLLLLLVGGGALIGLLVRSRRRLQASETALRRANATQQELMRIIGHDLRGPVATFQQITPLLYTALGPAPAPDDTELVRELDGTAQRLGALVDNLLHWARVQGGLVKTDPRRARASVAVASVVELYAPVARHKRVTLTHAVPPDLTLTTDLDLLTTVLRNLVSNAVKFTPAGGTVSLTAEAPSGGGVTFSVTDSGVGMTPAAVRAAFAETERTSQRGTAGEAGTGLGLPLCRRFVALLGGELHAAPNPGGGMRFWFQLA